jgi:hypothetical protein
LVTTGNDLAERGRVRVPNLVMWQMLRLEAENVWKEQLNSWSNKLFKQTIRMSIATQFARQQSGSSLMNLIEFCIFHGIWGWFAVSSGELMILLDFDPRAQVNFLALSLRSQLPMRRFLFIRRVLKLSADAQTLAFGPTK